MKIRGAAMSVTTSHRMGGACVWTPPQFSIPLQACRFGFLVRHIRAYRQNTRPCPVLPSKERSERHISRTDQVSMEDKLTVLTHKEQALLGTVRRRDVSTLRTSLRRAMSI